MTTIGIWIDRDGLAHLEFCRATFAQSLDNCTNLMTRNNLGLCHGIAAKESIEITTTETYILELEQYFARSSDGLGKIYDLDGL